MRFISYNMYLDRPAGRLGRNKAKVRHGFIGVPSHSSFAGIFMKKPELDPDVADVAPIDSALTTYDQQHVVTYARLLQAESEGADWREVARIVLHIDPERAPDRARNAYLSHLQRAKWVTEQGRLLRGAGSN
jgi:hypothetical protein